MYVGERVCVYIAGGVELLFIIYNMRFDRFDEFLLSATITVM